MLEILGSAPINNGAAMVQFTFTNLTTQASFDAYAWALGYDVKWSNDSTSSGYNVVLNPTANFTSNTTSGILPVTVQFTDTSTNNPTIMDQNLETVQPVHKKTQHTRTAHPEHTMSP